MSIAITVIGARVDITVNGSSTIRRRAQSGSAAIRIATTASLDPIANTAYTVQTGLQAGAAVRCLPFSLGSLLATAQYLWIMPKELAVDAFDPAKEQIGTGPFMFKSLQPDAEIKDKRHPLAAGTD